MQANWIKHLIQNLQH